MKRRLWIASVIACLCMTGMVSADSGITSNRTTSISVEVISPESVRVTGTHADLRAFARDWQTSLWPTWQTEDGSNAAIKQMEGIDQDIEKRGEICFWNKGCEFKAAIGYALSKQGIASRK